jgi:hypothetical protein
MFRCQHCKATIFLDWERRGWTPVVNKTCYQGQSHEPQQLAEFYRYKDGSEELFSTQDLILIRNGEMRLRTPNGDTLHYTDQVLKTGINNDDELNQLYDTGSLVVIRNPWFEIIDKSDPHGHAQVYDSLDEGLRVLFLIQDNLDTARLEYQQITNTKPPTIE